jgi:hypothetical protein
VKCRDRARKKRKEKKKRKTLSEEDGGLYGSKEVTLLGAQLTREVGMEMMKTARRDRGDRVVGERRVYLRT